MPENCNITLGCCVSSVQYESHRQTVLESDLGKSNARATKSSGLASEDLCNIMVDAACASF